MAGKYGYKFEEESPMGRRSGDRVVDYNSSPPVAPGQMKSYKDVEFVSENKKPKIPKKKKDSGFQDFAEGFGLSGLELYYGVKDLIGQGTEADKAVLKDWREDAGESGWGTGGLILGEIAQMAIPGGAIAKGVKLASKGKKLYKAGQMASKIPGSSIAATVARSPVLTDMASGAGLAYLRAPKEGETRAGAAGKEAIGAAAGGTLGYLLKPLAKGLKRSKYGKDAMDEGIRVTPHQMSSNPLVGASENIAAYMPGGGSINKARQIANDDWTMAAMNKVLPGTKVSDIGEAGFKQLDSKMNDMYTNAWKGAKQISRPDASKLARKSAMNAKSFPADRSSFESIQRMLNDIANPPPVNIPQALRGTAPKSPISIRQADSFIRDEIKHAVNKGSRPSTIDALQSTRKSLRANSGEGVKESLEKVDKHYPKFLAVEKASADAFGEPFRTKHLENAVKSLSENKDLAKGIAPLQKIVRIGKGTVDKKFAAAPFSMMDRLKSQTPMPLGITESARKVLTGTSSPIQPFFKSSNKYIKGARDLFAPSRVGAAYSNQ